MDLKAVMDGSGGRWTEERHSLFLNWIEGSFVRRMLGLHPDGEARLDRRVPDSATESTEDSRRRSPPAAVAVDPNPGFVAIVSRGRPGIIRKRSLQRYYASHDQVVPEFRNTNKDGNGCSSVKRKTGDGGM